MHQPVKHGDNKSGIVIGKYSPLALLLHDFYILMVKPCREAARRCRERKRTYIETLESNIRNLEKSQKDLLVIFSYFIR